MKGASRQIEANATRLVHVRHSPILSPSSSSSSSPQDSCLVGFGVTTDRRRCLLSHPGGQAGRNEKEREEGGDAIDDRVRGGNHEIRARRRMGPAAEEEKRREPEVPEGIMSNKPPSYTPFSWTLCVTILVTAKGQSSLVKLT